MIPKVDFLDRPVTLSRLALMYALDELGQSEVPGIKDNPRILEYESAVDGLGQRLSDSDVAWCSCFVNWCIQKAGGSGTRNPMARSWLNWGNPVKDPLPGDLAIFKRGLDPSSGHVGFVLADCGLFLMILSGNIDDKVCIQRFTKLNLLGFRRSKDS